MALYRVSGNQSNLWATIIGKKLTPLYTPDAHTQLLHGFVHRGETSYLLGNINDMLTKPSGSAFVTSNPTPKACNLWINDGEWGLQLLSELWQKELNHLNLLQDLQKFSSILSFTIETIKEKKVYLPQLSDLLKDNYLKKEHPAFSFTCREERAMELFLIHEVTECDQICFQFNLEAIEDKKFMSDVFGSLHASIRLENEFNQVRFRFHLDTFSSIAFSCIYLEVNPDTGKISPKPHWRGQFSKDSVLPNLPAISLIHPDYPAALKWDQKF